MERNEKFTSGEVAELLGVKDAYLHELHLDGRGLEPEVRVTVRRHYSLQNTKALREMLESDAKSLGTYLLGRRDGDHLRSSNSKVAAAKPPRPPIWPRKWRCVAIVCWLRILTPKHR